MGVAIFVAIEISLSRGPGGALSLWLFEMEINFACEKQLPGHLSKSDTRPWKLLGIVVVVGGV